MEQQTAITATMASDRPARTGLRAWWARRQDRIIQLMLLLAALTAIFGLALITVFIFYQGVPFIWRIGARDFFLSRDWSPTGKHTYGILAMIVGSLEVTIGAMVIAAVFGLGCAITLTQFCPRRLVTILKPAIELLAGIPSVVYGFIGMVTLVPLIRQNLGGYGQSLLAASIVLGVMVLPTVTSISVDALQAVPRPFRDGSIALGATQWQTTHLVMLRAARSGILAAFILGIGRAVGETMAVIMIAGNAVQIPTSLLDMVRTLTATIAIEFSYADEQNHMPALFAVGVTLFIIIMLLNITAMTVSRRRAGRAGT